MNHAYMTPTSIVAGMKFGDLSGALVSFAGSMSSSSGAWLKGVDSGDN